MFFRGVSSIHRYEYERERERERELYRKACGKSRKMRKYLQMFFPPCLVYYSWSKEYHFFWKYVKGKKEKNVKKF